MKLNNSQLLRYSRNIMLENFGEKGQQKLLSSKVLIIGAGGLGSPAALYLAAAGIGNIGIADNDKVDLTNLQRQIIHFSTDLNKHKTDSAKEKITMLNPEIKVSVYNTLITEFNINEIIDDYDFIIDATDNFYAKFLINDSCVRKNKAFSHAGVSAYEGQTLTYIPGSACYRCLFKEEPPENSVKHTSEVGILGSVAGIIGTIQATETIKYILNTGELLVNRILVFDALKMSFRKVDIKKNSNCPVCG